MVCNTLIGQIGANAITAGAFGSRHTCFSSLSVDLPGEDIGDTIGGRGTRCGSELPQGGGFAMLVTLASLAATEINHIAVIASQVKGDGDNIAAVSGCTGFASLTGRAEGTGRSPPTVLTVLSPSTAVAAGQEGDLDISTFKVSPPKSHLWDRSCGTLGIDKIINGHAEKISYTLNILQAGGRLIPSRNDTVPKTGSLFKCGNAYPSSLTPCPNILNQHTVASSLK